MYNCYMNFQVCYAYLNDVLPVSGSSQEILDNLKDEASSFRKSAWFTRGWTLQELIAPHNVRFYDQDWGFIGEKEELAELVSDITGISADVLKIGKYLRAWHRECLGRLGEKQLEWKTGLIP